MPSIFLSYRRADTSGYAGRLAAALTQRFGPRTVFQDVETIAPGNDFARAIEDAVARCQVVLVLIGDTWLTESGATGTRRLDDPQDFVRLEVAAALARGTVVLPVLLEGARMPAEDDLPAVLAPLARRQAIELSDSRWDYDFERLARAVAERVGEAPRGGRRRVLVAAAVLAGASAAGVGGWLATRPPRLAGRWDLPEGSWWIVVQDGRDLEIEEVHHESRQVWLRGTGRIEGRRVALAFELVFDDGTARGHVDIDPGERTLRGRIEFAPRGGSRRLLLVRHEGA